jgi:hypothetical protein
MLTHGKCHIIYFSSQRFDILISDQIVFKLYLWKYLEGLLTLKAYISWCFSLFLLLGFKGVLPDISVYFVFFPHGFPKLQDYDH